MTYTGEDGEEGRISDGLGDFFGLSEPADWEWPWESAPLQDIAAAATGVVEGWGDSRDGGAREKDEELPRYREGSPVSQSLGALERQPTPLGWLDEMLDEAGEGWVDRVFFEATNGG